MPPISSAARSAAALTSPYAQVGATLVDNGYSAIPCMPGSKFPGAMHFENWHAMTGWNKYCDRLPTPYEVRPWSQWKDAGVCLALDRVVKVVDIDTEDAAIVAALHEVLPDSPVKKRGSKGYSIFYRGSEAIESRSFTVAGERVLDLLGHGKQTVLPPTIHPTTGRPYTWLEGGDTLIDTTPDQLPELPDDIVEKLTEALAPFGYAPPKPRDPVLGDSNSAWREVNNIAMARLSDWVPALGLPRTTPTPNGYRAVAGYRPSGSGKPTQYRNLHVSFHPDGIVDWGDDDRRYTPIDMTMVARSLPFDAAFEWLRTRLGLKPKRYDFTKLVANIKKRQAERERLGLPDPFEGVDFYEETDDDEPEAIDAANDNDDDDERDISALDAVPPPPMHPDPFSFEASGGLLGRIGKWISSTSMTPVKEFSTFASIAILAGLFGRRAVTPSGLGLNVNLLTLARTGYGKNRPADALSDIADALGRGSLVVTGRPTSDAALLRMLRKMPSLIWVVDEAGMFLQSVNGRHANGATASLRDIIIELYTRSVNKIDGKQYASADRDNDSERIWFPTLTLYGMSTPTEFYQGLSESSQNDGFLNRVTIVAIDEQPKDQDIAPLPVVPVDLVDALKEAATALPRAPGNLVAVMLDSSTKRPSPHPVPYADDAAKAAWEAVRAWQRAVVDKDESAAGVVQRAAEQTAKFATIRAISRAPAVPMVTEDDVRWGWAIVHRSIMTLSAGVEKHMATSDFERLVKAARRHIVEAGPKGIARSKLVTSAGVSGADPRQMTMVIDRLREANYIRDVGTAAGRGRRGERYVAAS